MRKWEEARKSVSRVELRWDLGKVDGKGESGKGCGEVAEYFRSRGSMCTTVEGESRRNGEG